MIYAELIEGYVSCQEAKLKGLKKYFTGRPCLVGHVEERWVSNGTCCVCHAEHGKKSTKKWLENNKEKRAKIMKNWKDKNKEHIKAYDREYLRNNLEKRIRNGLRNRLNRAIKYSYKSGSAVRDLGCTIKFFISYMQDKFTSEMNWDNWGTVWQIDHVKSLSSFDLDYEDDFLVAVHYTNLQPLLIKDHIEKTKEDCKIKHIELIPVKECFTDLV